MLGQNEYGLYSLVISVIAYLTILDLGLGNAIVRYTAKLKAEGESRKQYEMFGMFIRLYSIIGIIAFILGLFLYFNIENIFSNTLTHSELVKAKTMIMLLIINVSISFPFSIFGSIITAYERFVFLKIVRIIMVISNTTIMLILLNFGYKSVSIVVLATILNVLSLAVFYVFCKKKLGIKIYFVKTDMKIFKDVLFYSMNIFLIVIMDRIYWSTGQFILGAYIGTAAVAIYALAIQLNSMYTSFSGAIADVFFPKITAMVAKNASSKEISDLFIKVSRLQFMVVAFILSGFILFGKHFIIYWAGNQYIDSFYIALLFFIPLLIPFSQTLGIFILQARNQLKFRSLVYFFIALLSLLMQLILVKKYNAYGCAFAITFSLVLGQIIIMNIYYYRKQQIDIPSYWKNVMKLSIVPITLIFTVTIFYKYYFINSPIDLVLSIIIFSLIYIPLFWLISMNEFEKDLIRKPVLKLIKKFKL
jgi:O-antigen/teichoic acid export membrane protein